MAKTVYRSAILRNTLSRPAPLVSSPQIGTIKQLLATTHTMSSNAVERRDMSRIKPIPGNPNPPLDPMNPRTVPYGLTISHMQSTGFHKWGLLILRCTSSYSDETHKWDAFVKRIRTSAENLMTRKVLSLPKDEATPALLLPLLRWDVMEDREALEGSGVEGAREWFTKWREGVCVQRDGEGADHLLVKLGLVARFRYFVMVDDECLASLPDGQEWDEKRERRDPPVKVRIVDAGPPSGVDHLRGAPSGEGGDETAEYVQGRENASSSGQDRSNEDDEEESLSSEEPTQWDDVGWMWIDARFLLSFYDILQADSGWDHFYAPPPKVYPRDCT